MRLSSVRLSNLPPFGDLEIPFCDEHGAARAFTVIHGGGGVGKTTILNAIAQTRPGNATSLSSGSDGDPALAVCDWILGHDDPNRPHALCIASPLARVDADDQKESLRRKEQALFDKLSRQGGFAFLSLSSTRWFSRQPLVLSAPLRTTARYDVRASGGMDDASRSDLARETKQALAYADISAALSRDEPTEVDFSLFSRAMHDAVDSVVRLAGYRYRGLEPASLEPSFHDESGALVPFDALPTRARHLVAFAALPVRMLWAAYPGRDPMTDAEGVVAIDEIDLHQDPAIQARLVTTLRKALPSVQWIVTTTSPHVAVACDDSEAFALRRLPNAARVELFAGSEARVH